MKIFKKAIIAGFILAAPASLFAHHSHSGTNGHGSHYQNAHYKDNSHRHSFVDKNIKHCYDKCENHRQIHLPNEKHLQQKDTHKEPKTHVSSPN